MGIPKVTYTLNGTGHEITFDPTKYSWFKTKWTRDQLASKNPFNGDKDWKQRGVYYVGTIYFEKMKKADFLALRDLWNKNIASVTLFPHNAEVCSFEVKVTSNLEWQDSYPEIIEDVTIIFEGKKRYDSPLEYDDGYWGARQVDFTEADPYDWATQRTNMNAADEASFSMLADVIDAFETHITSFDPHGDLYYTKTEVTDKISAATQQILVVAGIVDTDDSEFLGSSGMTGDIVRREGTISKIYIAYAGVATSKLTVDPGIDVKAGDIVTMVAGARDESNNVKFFLVVNHEIVWGTTGTYSNPAATQCLVSLLIE